MIVLYSKMVIRPMIACDHRIIDGKKVVQFLKRVKELVEEPEGLLLEGYALTAKTFAALRRDYHL